MQGDEVIAIVDDDQAIREPLREYFHEHGLPVVESDRGADVMGLLANRDVALVLLDIGLPDTDGLSLLPGIVDQYPDTAVVMLTGVADLYVALECIRKGATDYLSKPVQFNEIFHVAKKALEKRRLIFENRKYQEELEEAHFRIQLLHQLSMKMNSVYLSTVELDEILRAILVGITSEEGLGFNRAFLVMFDENQTELKGRLAIGPNCREEAGRVWNEIKNRDLSFMQLVHSIKDTCNEKDINVNRIAKALRIPVTDTDNILIKSALDRRSFKVGRENGCVPIPIERRVQGDRNGAAFLPYERRLIKEDLSAAPMAVPHDLINLLDEDTFVVVPLYSPGRPFGVLIADNYVTRRPIMDSHVSSLELFASQASLAIEHSHLYIDMEKKIAELEALNHELDKNKDLLVEAERYSALGQMAAQMVHTLRNPITSIGGVSRILSKKVSNEEWSKYLTVIIKETKRLESTLEDLFDFVTYSEPVKEQVPLCAIIRKTVLLVHNLMSERGIAIQFDFPDQEPELALDVRQFRQMLLHLTRNAIDAMPEGGTLVIAVKIIDGQLMLSVIDSGMGIPDAHIGKATDPFFTTKTYGTGMGLTLVERAVEAHDGFFSLIKLPGGGLEARIILPFAQ